MSRAARASLALFGVLSGVSCAKGPDATSSPADASTATSAEASAAERPDAAASSIEQTDASAPLDASAKADVTLPIRDAAAASDGAARAARCSAKAEVTSASGAKKSCYPYLCRNGTCLESCSNAADCAGSRRREDLAADGWPLECLGAKCVPLPPSKVNPGAPR